MAPPSTIEYYRAAVEIHRKMTGRPPRVLINSIDGDEVLGYLATGRRPELVGALLSALHQLDAGGADVALLASASVHVVFDEVRPASPLPLVGMMDATADAVARFERVGLLATRFTVQADLFSAALAPRGVTVIVPTAAEQELIDRVYFDELVSGRFLSASRDRLATIGERLRTEEGVEAVLLGGTELPLLLAEAMRNDLPYLDTARIHAEAAVAILAE